MTGQSGRARGASVAGARSFATAGRSSPTSTSSWSTSPSRRSRTTSPARRISGLSWVLSGYAIVFAALLVPAGRLADLARPQAPLPRRPRRVRGRVGALRGGARPVVARGRARGAGGGGRSMIPTSLGTRGEEFPPERRAAAVGLWTRRRGGGGHASARRSAGCWSVELAGDLPDQPPARSVIAVAAVRISGVARPRPGAAARPARPLLLIVAVGALALGIGRGASGLSASPGVLGAWAVALVAGASGSASARRATPRRCWSFVLLRAGRAIRRPAGALTTSTYCSLRGACCCVRCPRRPAMSE